MLLNRTTVALDRANFVQIIFDMQLIRKQFTIQIYIVRLHEYLVASDHTPIVSNRLYVQCPFPFLSQLAHEHLTTFCNRNALDSHEL